MENGKLKIEKGDAVSLPNGWESNQLGDVCNVQRGLTYSGRDTVDISNNVVLRATNIHLDSSSLIFDELKYLSDDFEIKETYKLRKGALLICFSSGSKSHLGKVALIDKDYNYAFGGFIGQVTPTSKILSEYLFYSLISEKYKDYISKLTDGVNINNLKIKDLQAFPIPIPPLDEQKRIVAKLDELFALIENGKLKVENLLADAKELFQSQLNEIFGNGKLKVESGKWVEKKLGEVCDIVNGGTPKTSVKEYWGGSLLWITPKDMGKLKGIFVDNTSRKITELGLNKSSAKLLPINSIILSSRAPIGHLAINKKSISTNQGCKGLVPNDDIEPKFLFYFLKNSVKLLNELGSGTTFKELSGKKLSSVILPYTDLDTQKQIVQQLDDLKSHTQALESKYQQELDALDELKKSILQKAFEGEL